MKRSLLVALALLVGLSGALLGQTQFTLNRINPTETTASGPTFSMVLVVSNMPVGTVRVLFNDTPIDPTSVGANQITAQIPSGLILNWGTVNVAVSVQLPNGGTVSSTTLPFTINPLPVIATTSLNTMMVGVLFSQTLTASFGTRPYSNWRVVEGLLPAELGLDLNTGVISGIPTVPGSGSALVFVTDSAGVSASHLFSWTVNPAVLTITPNSVPNATAGSAYSQAFAVNGGISPYTWSSSGTLSPGLTFSAGLLSGTPTQGGTSNFTVRVVDTSGSFTTKAFSLTVTVPTAPTLSVTGLTDTVSPAQQPTFDVQLSSTYPLAITGTVTLTFTPNAVNAANDPAIQFSGGGRTLNFTIPAGQTRAFPTTLPLIQTGTVAGQIDLTLSFSAGGLNITPATPPVRSLTIARAAPKINTVQVVKVTGGFNILVTGYSTPRQVTQAVFTFTPATGANLQTTQVTVPVDSAFTTWYTGNSSPQFGSSFLYTQPFTVQGSVSDIVSVSVTLSNATGTSTAVSANF
jgi:hypothetical protein